jgi:integrase
VATIVNQSRFIVSVKRRPDLDREFPHARAAEAKAYRDHVIRENPPLKAGSVSIERGPTKLLVRIRRRGLPAQSEVFDSEEAAENYITTMSADLLRGLAVDTRLARRTTLAERMQLYIDSVCPTHKGEDVEVTTLTGMLADSRNLLANEIKEFDAAKKRGENPKPIRSRRQPRAHLEWLHLPLTSISSAHIDKFKEARLRQVKPATVKRELDLISAVLHKAFADLYKGGPNPMKGVTRPICKNGRTRRLESDEQERLFISARREDLLRSRELALEPALVEVRERAKLAKNKSARQRYMKRERRLAVRRLDRRYPVVPLFETLIAFLLETAARLSEALTLRWQDINFTDETAFFPDTKNGSSRTVPIQRFTIELLRALPRTGDWVFDLTEGAYDGAWERIAERAGLREKVRSNKKACEKDFHTHDLRHEALSRISEVGQANDPTYDVFALKAISGHKDITSLARYINPIPKLLTKRLNRSFAEAGIMLDAGAPRRIVRARQPHPPSRTAANVIAFPARQRPKPSASALGAVRPASTAPANKPSKL